jgi:hypothetical protein
MPYLDNSEEMGTVAKGKQAELIVIGRLLERGARGSSEADADLSRVKRLLRSEFSFLCAHVMAMALSAFVRSFRSPRATVPANFVM